MGATLEGTLTHGVNHLAGNHDGTYLAASGLAEPGQRAKFICCKPGGKPWKHVETCSHDGVWHWASSSSNGTHSPATDTMLVWASCEEVVVMAIFSSTRPARDGSVATPQRCSRLARRCL